MHVPFYDLAPQHHALEEKLQASFAAVLKKNWFILGESLTKFEHAFAAYCGVKYCVGVGSGLDALRFSLMSLKLSPGDEVIVPAHTYIATILAIKDVGLKPILVEPCPETLLLTVEAAKRGLTEKTRAILPVHLYGAVCPMPDLIRFAAENKLKVVEDNAQAVGSSWQGQPSGSFGHANAVSFYPTKNLGALGDGGAVLTDDEEIAQFCRTVRNYGSEKKYHNLILGENSRLDEFQAAFLSQKLQLLEAQKEEKKQLVAHYRNAFQALVGICLLPQFPETMNWHLFPVFTSQRDELAAFLKQKSIGTVIHYPIPSHLQPALRDLGYKKGDFPHTEHLAEETLSLPLFPGMTEAQQEYVIEAVVDFFETKTW